jgi:transposase
VIEHKLYWSSFAAENEALYLAAVLNSETARSRTAALQSRGQWGARDFDKVLFTLPIPRYDNAVSLHTALRPIHALIERHVLAAERLHGDDTTVPILAKGKTVTGRIWTYVRDDRPFGGRAPPAALYYASRDRKHEHPARHLQNFTGLLQADAYSSVGSNSVAGLALGQKNTFGGLTGSSTRPPKH